MSPLGLTPKLRLAPLWPALAAVASAAALIWYLLPGLFEQSASVQLLDTLQIFTPVVAERAGDPRTDLQAWVRRLATGAGLRITLVRSDGLVLCDSARTAAQVAAMENHSSRPEIRQALAQGQGVSVRKSSTV
ncbi:MAG: hypothetical protein M3O15_15315, partial [Acidobacteriota bacterium]|nr:hypothetical protein [Acidobacteriota bacterium]